MTGEIWQFMNKILSEFRFLFQSFISLSLTSLGQGLTGILYKLGICFGDSGMCFNIWRVILFPVWGGTIVFKYLPCLTWKINIAQCILPQGSLYSRMLMFVSLFPWVRELLQLVPAAVKTKQTELTSVARLIVMDPVPLFVLNLSGIRGEQCTLGLNL